MPSAPGRLPSRLLVSTLLVFLAGGALAGESPPMGAASLLPWLESGRYRGWAAESGPHASAGPHFGKVRAFINPSLAASMGAADTEHRPGAAAVKELYGGGDRVRGWSVSIKLDGAGIGGARWYWFEYFDGRIVADARGAPLCASCHAAGRDFVLSTWPLP